MVTQNFWFMMQTKAEHTVLYNVYPYIRLSRERLGFYAKIQIIFGTVHVSAICQGKFWVQVLSFTLRCLRYRRVRLKAFKTGPEL